MAPINNGLKVSSALEEKERQTQPDDHRVVFFIGSPEREMKDAESSYWMKKPIEGFGAFLKTCVLCKNRLNAGRCDVYMYGYLGAFCSRECRNNQLALDEAKEFSARMKMAERNACRRGG